MNWTFLSGVAFIGLLVGSFLNVVIIRLPKIIAAEAQGKSIKNLLTLCLPRSHCPHCKHPIAIYHNIPLWSYFQLKGRCHHCHHAIAIQYPLVEGFASFLSLMVAIQYGESLQTLAALCLVWVLIPLTVIDIKHHLLPDTLTLPFLWLGLLFNTYNLFDTPSSAILGAIYGYLSLWSLYWVFKWITGKEGMGYGDFKLMALMGAWFGCKALLFIVFFSSILGSIWGLWLILFQHKNRHTAIPFGPCIAIAGCIVLFFHSFLELTYFKIIGL
jgi:leader peptidase (prepilin peptidase)/N-methyltransferase